MSHTFAWFKDLKKSVHWEKSVCTDNKLGYLILTGLIGTCTVYIPLISRVRGPYGKLWTEFFSFLLWPKREARRPWKQGRKKRGSITCHTDWANEANKMFIIWLCWLFRFWKGNRELEVRMATYGPGIDQSQHTKSVSHIINLLTYWYMNCINQLMFYLTVYYFINKVAFLKLHHSAIQVYE